MGIDPALIGDICVGELLAACLQRRGTDFDDAGSVNLATPSYVARSCALAAGFPETVPVQAINR